MNKYQTIKISVSQHSHVHFNLLLREISQSEVVQALKQLHPGQSPGPDALPTDFYQWYLDDIIDLLTSRFNEGIQSGCMEDSFYEGVMSLLYKKETNVFLIMIDT